MTTEERVAERRVTAYMEELSADSVGAIHSAEGAKKYGYEGALVGGVTVYGWAVPTILEAVGADWYKNGWANFQFRRPVYAGDEITVRVSAQSEGDFDLLVSKDDDTQRCIVGSAGSGEAPWLSDFQESGDRTASDIPDDLPPLTLENAPIGQDLRAVLSTPTGDDARAYAARLNDSNPLWTGDDPLLHPAWFANILIALRSTFTFGPSMHASSDVQYLAPATPDQRITLAARLVNAYERRGHHYASVHGVYRGEDGTELTKVRYTTVFKIAERS